MLRLPFTWGMPLHSPNTFSGCRLAIRFRKTGRRCRSRNGIWIRIVATDITAGTGIGPTLRNRIPKGSTTFGRAPRRRRPVKTFSVRYYGIPQYLYSFTGTAPAWKTHIVKRLHRLSCRFRQVWPPREEHGGRRPPGGAPRSRRARTHETESQRLRL